MYAVTDLCDEFDDQLDILEPVFTDFGGQLAFGGEISTVRCFEDNSVVQLALEEPGEGRVLVVDGGGSERCALLGDNLSQMAIDNGWVGLVVYGCIRDAEAISHMPIPVKALNTHPKRPAQKNIGERDVPVHFAGVRLMPGDWLYADLDGMAVSKSELSL